MVSSIICHTTNISKYIDYHLQTINTSNRMFKRKIWDKFTEFNAAAFPLSVKYNRKFPKIKEIVLKLWHLLHINPNLAEILQNPSILAFRRNKNLRDIIGTKLFENDKFKRKFTDKVHGKCTPCLANNRTFCYKQVANTATFRSNQTNRIFQIYHNLYCKRKYLLAGTHQM